MSTFKIVVYSDDSTVRETVKRSLGARLAVDLPENEILEFTTADALRLFVDSKKVGSKTKVDLFILDGESTLS